MYAKNIFILTPDHTEAGGIESLYQLASAINDQGGSAITIFNSKEDKPIPERYKHYNINYSDTLEDHENSLFIVPEIWTSRLNLVKKCKKAIWWLSVEHNYNQFRDFKNQDIFHFCQSNYALDYLYRNGNYKADILNDWVKNNQFQEGIKKDIVSYNPAKGKEITQKIIDLNPDIKFVPIENLSMKEVDQLLSISKVYIDFGNHPGRDRIPREAAMLGNCIITNKSGSAKFYADIPIADKYKHESFEEVGTCIKDCFVNYQERIREFTFYRSWISKQKEELYSRTSSFFF
jgi:hypothetical protein